MLTTTSAHEPVAMRTRSRKALILHDAKLDDDSTSKTAPITPSRTAKRSRTSSDDTSEVIELEDINSRPVLSLGSLASQRREQSVQWIINTSKRLRFQKETLFLGGTPQSL